MIKWVKYILILLSGSTSVLQAQTVRGLQENPVIKEHLSNQPLQTKSAHGVLLTLPFFEDFSRITIYPDQARWSDKYAFINNSFGLDPVSAGVATLDAINEYGEVYSLNSRATSSDMLTSQSFDLSMFKNTPTTVLLSFFYQSGGKGETPELNDSLLLEYYSPVSDRWMLAWFATSEIITEFKQQILQVPDSLYLQGFKFRFRNYTSISINDVSGGEGALGNADCWNIDYIMMNTEPLYSHQVINDITLTDLPRNMLDIYETIPWLHLNNASPVIARNDMNYDIRNMMAEGDLTNTGRSYYIKDLNTGYRENYEAFFEELPTDTFIRRDDPFFAPFTRRDDSKEGFIEVVSYLVTPAGQVKQNDTTKTVLHFKDTYVFDDGTPEFGFGIEGPSMNGALLALKFRLFDPDTLQAVDMLFNKSRDLFNETLKFRLCVWKDGGDQPGELLYMSQEEYSPRFDDDKPAGFTRYPVNAGEPLYIADSVIYVGWKQLTDEFLNLGYDVNRNNLSRTFVNLAGEWINPGASLIPGTVMIRAVVGGRDVITSDSETPVSKDGIILYPNPVKHFLHIAPEDLELNSVHIFDMSGRTVIQQTGNSKHIDLTSLSPGIYQVVIISGNNRFSRKIVVRQ